MFAPRETDVIYQGAALYNKYQISAFIIPVTWSRNCGPRDSWAGISGTHENSASLSSTADNSLPAMEEDSRHAYFMKQALLMVMPAPALYIILSKSSGAHIL